MVSIPVLAENLDFERLDLHRHYVVIDCDFTVYLILNPIGEKPLSGTDIAVINIGSWQLDAWKFLVKDNFPNEAGFSAVLAWDKTLVQETEQGRKRPRITESDVDIANSVSSLKGQPVNITGFSLDDGKSLKVSTLEDEYVNIRSFYSPNELCKIFPFGNVRRRIKVGSEFDVNFIRQFSEVEEIEGGYRVKPNFLAFSCDVSETYSNHTKNSYVINDGFIKGGFVSSNTSVSYAVDGGVVNYYVDIILNELSILSINIFLSGVFFQNQEEGYVGSSFDVEYSSNSSNFNCIIGS